MEEDIEFEINNKKFKLRVNGIVIFNNKVLTVEMYNNGFFCLPGGHICIGEDSKNAIKREYFEETGIDCEVDKLVAITENFFERKDSTKIHEISYYYLLIPNKEFEYKEEYNIIEDDHGEQVQHHFKWLDLFELERYNFKPSKIVNQLKNLNNLKDFNHYIIK